MSHYTGFLLRRAYVRSRDCARACISDDAQLREVAVLAALAERGAISQRELGELLHVNRSIMVKIVDVLERKHQVARERNPADRRSYALRLTPAGERARRRAQLDLDRSEAVLAAALTPEQVGRLKHLLRLLAAETGGLSSLADRLGYLIAQAHRVCRERAEVALAPLGLNPRDFGALSTIARLQPCSQSELAASLGISPPMALAFVDGLQSAGLVVRDAHPHDRRVHALRLTPAGTTALAAARERAGRVQREIAALLGAGRDAELRALLGKVLASV